MPAAPATWLEEFVVNLTTTGVQNAPTVITLSNGNILVSWTTTDDTAPADAAGSDILGRIFDPLGNPLTGEIRLNQGFFADDEVDADLASFPGGGFVMVYEDVEDGNTSLRLNLFGSDGVSTRSTTVVSDSDPADPAFINPRVAAAGNNSVFIVYEEVSGGVSNVRGRVYNVATDTFSDQISLLGVAGGNTFPDVAALGNGNYVIVARNGASDSGIYMRIVDGNGANVLGFTPIQGTHTNTYPDADPVVTALVGGGFAVAWTGSDANDTDILVAVYNDAGGLVGSGSAGGSATDSDNEPSIVGLADGTFVVLYDDDEFFTVEVARFSATGSYLGNTRLSDVDPDSLSVSALPDGRIAAVWERTGGEIVMEILDVRDAQSTAGTMFTGTAGADVITVGVESAIWVGGGAGDDVINSGNFFPYRTFDGGDGNDTINVQSILNEDVYRGGAGNDTINWSQASVSGGTFNLETGLASRDGDDEVMTGFENLIATSGTDHITGNGQINQLYGGGGADTAYGEGGADQLFGGAGNDILYGGGGFDLLNGGADDDTLYGDAGEDSLTGGAGGDFLEGGAGADILNGGASTDLASYASSNAGVTINLNTGTASGGHAQGDVLIDIEYLWGSAFNDTLTGTSANNLLFGREADDLIQGGGGADSLYGEDGADTLQGGAGSDVLVGGVGADALQGGADADFADYGASNAAVTINLATGAASGGHAAGDTFSSIENISASAFDDSLVGDAVANYLWGADGQDTILGGDGDDTLDGYTGNDLLNGGNGSDVLVGGDGADTLNGAAGDDGLFGGVGTDTLLGGAGVDNLVGDVGNDSLNGGSDNDNLDGGSGADVLIGGTGNDRLTGGVGNDTFVFGGTAGIDRIADFAAGPTNGDKIQLDSAMFSGFADVLSNTNDDGLGNTVISKFGLQITLEGVLKAQLHANDFEFVAMAPAGDPKVVAATPFPGDDPEILPAGFDGKTPDGETPVICPPGDLSLPGRDLGMPALVELDISTSVLSPHRAYYGGGGLDWII